MKKKLQVLVNPFAVAIAVILLLCGMLMPLSAGCDDKVLANENSQEEENNSPEDAIDMPELDAETELLIKQAYLVYCFEKGLGNTWVSDNAFQQRDGTIWTINDVIIQRYCGVHNGCTVALIGGCGIGYIQVTTAETVAGVPFHYGDANHLRVLKNGVFYGLQDAYNENLITIDDLYKISVVFHAR